MQMREFIKGMEFLSTIDRDMQISTALTLLYAAEKEGQHQIDLEERTGLSNAAISRNVAYWSKWKRHKVSGYDMMESVIDPADRRYRILTLTKKGTAFINRLKEQINGR